MRLIAKLLYLSFAVVAVHTQDLPSTDASECYKKCQVLIGSTTAFVNECANRLNYCTCNPNSNFRKDVIKCVNDKCTSTEAQAAPATLDDICKNLGGTPTPGSNSPTQTGSTSSSSSPAKASNAAMGLAKVANGGILGVAVVVVGRWVAF